MITSLTSIYCNYITIYDKSLLHVLYSRYLWDELGDKSDDVHIFNSFFYSRLLDPRKDDVNVKK